MRAPSSAAGKRGRCKGCGAILDIPLPSDADRDADASEGLGIALDAPPSPRASTSGSSSPPPLPDVVASSHEDEGNGEAEDLGAVIGIRTVGHSRLGDESDDEPRVRSSLPSRPHEPWYYRWLDVIGTISAILAVGSFCIGTAVGLALMLSNGGNDESGRWGGAPGLMIVVSTTAATLPLFIWGMIMRLMVDAARNLRALRYARN